MTPDLQFSLLCDEVRREDNGKFIFIGVFEALASLQYPLPYPSLCVVNRWCNGEGKYSQKVRIVGAENSVLAETKESPVELAAMLANITAISVFRQLTFPKEGRYWVEVLLNGDLKQRYPLTALKMQLQGGPGGAASPP
jgi:hypothetical protein